MNSSLFGTGTGTGATSSAVVTIEFGAEPIRSTLAAMSLLSNTAWAQSSGPWIAQAAQRLSETEQGRNRLIFETLGPALLTAVDYADFDAYLDAFGSHPATELRDRVLEQADLDEARLAARGIDPSRLQTLLNQPTLLRKFVVEHLRALWQREFAAEWARSAARVETLVQMLGERSWPATSSGRAIRSLLRREAPEEIAVQLHNVRRIVFVPTPYLELHAARFGEPEHIYIFALAEFQTLPLRQEPIKIGELLSPLKALADESRLGLLQLMAAHEEMLAQEIIAQVEIGQPTVSRHLKQLHSAGIIEQERGTGANKRYRINHERLEWLHFSLTELLSSENARAILSDVRIGLSTTLQRFLDREGRLTDWPARANAQQEVLVYLSERFESGVEYDEAQVNQLLNQWHTFNDPAYVRRALVDAGLLRRTDDGARYWRA
ncbi:MAG: metalloregulator ArsR/SmtB family transcription factor [Caldilineaceae bacterium]|nr:metalloregulator ArsR/SmtB family transcription factor [Caldilineaceae bacterium]